MPRGLAVVLVPSLRARRHLPCPLGMSEKRAPPVRGIGRNSDGIVGCVGSSQTDKGPRHCRGPLSVCDDPTHPTKLLSAGLGVAGQVRPAGEAMGISVAPAEDHV